VKSTGTTGEKLAELWFQAHGWRMFRTQPATRVIWQKGKPIIINCGKGGIADYTGYCIGYSGATLYRACEVKEAEGESMPASRLSKDQRAWMESLPPACAYVIVVWMDGNIKAECFPFVSKGSYHRSRP
jgi:hypothetical protein